MVFEPPAALYDACVLYPFHLRNLLIQCAVDRVVRAHWTDAIHDEWVRSLAANDPTIPLRRLYAARDLMNAVLPSARVADYEAMIPSIALPDPDDRHVVAAAVAAGASLIVTWNVRDFPAVELRKHRLGRQTADVFLAKLFDEVPALMIAVTARARRNLRQSRVSAEEFLSALRRQKLIRFTSKVERHLPRL